MQECTSCELRQKSIQYIYLNLENETIEELKNANPQSKTTADQTLETDYSVQIKLGISLLIPEDYMQDLSLRMSFYKKIATIKNDGDQENLINEMTDRFGKVPLEILNLMEIAKLKSLCKKLGVEKLEAASEGILISFKDNIEIGGLLLCKRPEEYGVQEKEYFDRITKSQMEAVDNNLMRQSDARMPIFKESRSSTSFGKGS